VRIDWLFILSCVANIAWLFLWHYNLFGLTLLVMLALLACLIAIYLRLGIGKVEVPAAERWLGHQRCALGGDYTGRRDRHCLVGCSASGWRGLHVGDHLGFFRDCGQTCQHPPGSRRCLGCSDSGGNHDDGWGGSPPQAQVIENASHEAFSILSLFTLVL
jgi:hypothetical protein